MISIHLDTDGNGALTLPSGLTLIENQPSYEAGRATALRHLTDHAQQVGHAIEARSEENPPVTLMIYPNGTVTHTNPAPQQTPAETPERNDPMQETAPPPAHPPAFPTAEEPPAHRARNPEPVPVGANPPATVAQPSFVKERPAAPAAGMRGTLYKLTGGLVNLGPSAAQKQQAALHDRIRKPIRGTRNITTMCLKGGIGKTSTTVGVGLTLAQIRADLVLAIDANPDAGDFADRARGQATVAGLTMPTINQLADAVTGGQVRSWVDLNEFTQRSGRLHFIASEQDPAESESLTAEAYADVRSITDQFYPLTLTDCGTGVTHPAMSGILANTQQIVIAAGWAVTGADKAIKTLDWLHARYSVLARNAVVVLTEAGGVSKDIDRDAIRTELEHLCRAVHLVPFDPAIAKGDRITLDELRPGTRHSFAEVSASIVDAI